MQFETNVGKPMHGKVNLNLHGLQEEQKKGPRYHKRIGVTGFPG